MRLLFVTILVAFGLVSSNGCSNKPNFNGPTVDAFTGRVTQNGQPIRLPEGSGIQLKMWHESGTSFLIPLDSEGKFKIGWMPIGKYSLMLEGPPPPGGRGAPMKQSIENRFSIEDGKTDYTIELGPNVKF
jgi:hypothetical protein